MTTDDPTPLFEEWRRTGKRALRNNLMVALAAVAFVAIFFFNVPFPLIILSAAVIGYGGARLGRPEFAAIGHGGGGSAVIDSMMGDEVPDHVRPNAARALLVGAIWLALWLTPVLASLALFGSATVFSQIAVFFSKMAMVTFGGAYAVLAYVAQQAVETYHWLQPREMLDGLGMAETTPGPLIMVTQFVGFLAAFREATGLPPLVAATFGAILTTWVTFLPCFLWIFAGAPFIERLRGNRALSAALSAITAAVVGVILNLAVWFGIHTLFEQVREVPFAAGTIDLPVLTSVNWPALALAVGAILAMFRFKAGMLPVLGVCSVLGAAYVMII